VRGRPGISNCDRSGRGRHCDRDVSEHVRLHVPEKSPNTSLCVSFAPARSSPWASAAPLVAIRDYRPSIILIHFE
jgi:hypothetical protein